MPRTGRLGRFVLGFAGGIALGLLVLAVWFGFAGALAARDAMALRADAEALQDAAAERTYLDGVSLLPSAASHAAGLHARLASAPLSWAQDFPWIGTTVEAGAVMARAADEVLSQFNGWSSGLVTASASGDLGMVAVTLDEAEPNLAGVATAARAAARDVEAVDVAAVLGPAQAPLAALRERVLTVLEPLGEGAAAGRVLPGMLGAQEPVRWLVVLGQPSEARGSGGGFYGARATVQVAGGQLAIVDARANNTGTDETNVARDISALPAEYGRLWGSDAEYLFGYNLTRHYPYAAPVAHAALDPSADYVVSLDPRSVAGLLALTGPVTVDGVTLHEANAEQFFARDIYIRYPDSSRKDAVMLAFLQQTFGQLAGIRLDPEDLWRALGPVVGGGHIQVWSPDDATAAALADSPLGGAVPDAGPWVTAAFNNTAGNKIDSYIASSLEYRATGSCEAGLVAGTLTATLEIEQIPEGLPGYISGRNDRPEAPYGTTSMFVHLYAPVGAVGEGFAVNGEPSQVIAGREREHPVWGTKVQLAPGQPVTVSATFTQPAYPGQPLVAVPQPMVQDTAVTVIDERSCGVG